MSNNATVFFLWEVMIYPLTKSAWLTGKETKIMLRLIFIKISLDISLAVLFDYIILA